MITAITATNYLGESIRLELMKPENSGFVVQSIDGLGPVKANVNFTELATLDGAIDNSARLGTRNIVLQLLFLLHPTIEDTRLLSYKYFPVKKEIHLVIETDNRICETTGRVESNEPSIFSRNEGCQISILCPDPYFYEIGEKSDHNLVLSIIEPLFELPFSNESLSEKLIEFGSIDKNREVVIEYVGDGDIGVMIKIYASGPIGDLTIYHLTTNEILKIDAEKLEKFTGSQILNGDEINISTVRGSKSITLIRNGKRINILNCLDRESDWFQLIPGINVFTFKAETGSENVRIVIENGISYEGV